MKWDQIYPSTPRQTKSHLKSSIRPNNSDISIFKNQGGGKEPLGPHQRASLLLLSLSAVSSNFQFISLLVQLVEGWSKYSHFCFREPLESSNLIFTSCKSEKRYWRSNTRFDKSFAFIQFLSKQTETGHTAAREHPRSEVCHEHVGWEYDQGFLGSDLI